MKGPVITDSPGTFSSNNRSHEFSKQYGHKHCRIPCVVSISIYVSCMSMYVFMCIQRHYLFTCVCIYIYMYACIYIYTYTYGCIYTYTYVYAYIKNLSKHVNTPCKRPKLPSGLCLCSPAIPARGKKACIKPGLDSNRSCIGCLP